MQNALSRSSLTLVIAVLGDNLPTSHFKKYTDRSKLPQVTQLVSGVAPIVPYYRASHQDTSQWSPAVDDQAVLCALSPTTGLGPVLRET